MTKLDGITMVPWASLSAASVFGQDQYQALGDSDQPMHNLNSYGTSCALHVTYDLN